MERFVTDERTRLEARQQVGYSAIIFFVFIFARMPSLF